MHFPITLVTLVAPLIVSAAPWKRALSLADLQVLSKWCGGRVIRSGPKHPFCHRVRKPFGAI
jgi:hypothetical protein